MEGIASGLQSIALGFSQESLMEIIARMRKIFPMFSEGCFRLFEDQETLDRLKAEQFDLIITLPFSGCDALLAEYLNVPFIVMTPLRRTPSFSEDTFGIPAPSSTYRSAINHLHRSDDVLPKDSQYSDALSHRANAHVPHPCGYESDSEGT